MLYFPLFLNKCLYTLSKSIPLQCCYSEGYFAHFIDEKAESHLRPHMTYNSTASKCRDDKD